MRWTVVFIVILLVVVGLWLAGTTKSGSGSGELPLADESESASNATKTKAGGTGKLKSTADTESVDVGLRFVEVSGAGIDFVHRSGISKERHYPSANGSGLATIDIDLDGQVDLYFGTGQYFLRPDDVKLNRFYRSLGGWQFEDCTAESGLGLGIFTAGLAAGDFNEDGFPDLYVTSVGENQLLMNAGDGTFHPVKDSSANDDGFAASAAFFDYDNDGLLDLYVCNYSPWSIETNKTGLLGPPHNMVIYCLPSQLPTAVDVMYHNNGDGTFSDVTSSQPFAARPARSQGVLALDLNDDDLTDLYVGNDMNPNWTFINDGQGSFKDLSQIAGTAYGMHGKSQAGMGLASADVNRDGRFDLIVTNFQREYNALYMNQGDGLFSDGSQDRGIIDKTLEWVGWGVTLNDFNLDGWPDLFVTNGHVDPLLSKYGGESAYEQPPGFWVGSVKGFQYAADRAGSYFDGQYPGRGLAVSDIDNDGDFDVIVGHIDQAPALLRNELETDAESVEVRLVGTRVTRDAIGAKVSVRGIDPPLVLQVVGGGSYLSANDTRLLVPAAEKIDLDIVWPGGRRSAATGLVPGRRYVIAEPTRGRQALVTRLP